MLDTWNYYIHIPDIPNRGNTIDIISLIISGKTTDLKHNIKISLLFININIP